MSDACLFFYKAALQTKVDDTPSSRASSYACETAISGTGGFACNDLQHRFQQYKRRVACRPLSLHHRRDAFPEWP